MSETTTDAAAQDTQAPEEVITTDQAQLAEEQPAEAVPTTDSEPTTEDDAPADEPAQPADTSTADAADELSDEQILAWAEKKGIDMSTPEGQAKALRSIRTAEKKMHTATSQASELNKQIAGQSTVDPDATDAQRALQMATDLQNTQIINAWKSANNVTAAEDAAMGKYAQDNPETAQLLRDGRLTLDQFRALSGASQKPDVDAIKRQGGQEALESLANKQRTTSVPPSATVSTPPPAGDPIADALAAD